MGLIFQKKRILLVGSCGMGVAPLGLYLVSQGHDVYGIDDYPVSRIMDRLEKAGIHNLDNLYGGKHFDEVVLSRAIEYDTKRMLELKLLLPDANFYFRGDYLRMISDEYRTVAIAGSHGKTATTAILIDSLKQNGFSFSYILGGFFAEDQYPAGCYDSNSDWLIIEVDESDRTIEGFSPEVTVITNIDLDHVDAYENENEVREVFLHLAGQTHGKVFLDNEVFEQLEKLGLSRSDSRIHMHEISKESSFQTQNFQLAESVASCLLDGDLQINKPLVQGIIPVERRQEIKKLDDKTVLIEDYAHHPTELAALLCWVGKEYPDCELQVVFQPHRYTRTKALLPQFVNELKGYNCYLIPEYGAFEHRDADGSSQSLYRAVKKSSDKVDFCETPAVLAEALLPNTGGRRVILFAGAGDIPFWAKWVELSINHKKEGPDFIWKAFHSGYCGNQCKLMLSEPLKKKVTLNVGGTARYYAEPESMYALQLLIKTSYLLDLPMKVIGRGSNILIKDGEFDGLIIRLNRPYWKHFEYLGEGKYLLRAGVAVKELCRNALECGVRGFNFFDGIPGSVGGVIRMNAGAMGYETADRLVEVECLNREGKIVRLKREEMDFSYRNCADVAELIVTTVILQGVPDSNSADLEIEMKQFREKRFATQPADPSAGCMFKNPLGDSAGRLIDATGLKGYRMGGAMISEKHGNFLVTEKNTTSSDVCALLNHVKIRVKEVHGIELEQEIKHL